MLEATVVANHDLLADLHRRYQNNGLRDTDDRIINGFSNPVWWYMVLGNENVIDYVQSTDLGEKNYCIRNKREVDVEKIVQGIYIENEDRLKSVFLGDPYHSSPR